MLKFASLWALPACLSPNEQLATLAPLVHLKIVMLELKHACKTVSAEDLLRLSALLSLPPSVTKLVLSNSDYCLPLVALPENVAVVFSGSVYPPPYMLFT